MIEYELSEFLMKRKEKTCEGSEPGVYLICNKHKMKYYVGQSEKPLDRVFSHATGSGNGDVYVDYIAGNHMTVRFYTLDEAQFRDLNELEYHLIRIYDANVTGYNRRAGNKTRQFVKS